jgi:hypothetical protein
MKNENENVKAAIYLLNDNKKVVKKSQFSVLFKLNAINLQIFTIVVTIFLFRG